MFQLKGLRQNPARFREPGSRMPNELAHFHRTEIPQQVKPYHINPRPGGVRASFVMVRGMLKEPPSNSESTRDKKTRQKAFKSIKNRVEFASEVVFFTQFKSEVTRGHQSQISGIYTLHDKVSVISITILAGRKMYKDYL